MDVVRGVRVAYVVQEPMGQEMNDAARLFETALEWEGGTMVRS